MKKIHFIPVAIILILLSNSTFGQKSTAFDLHKLAKAKGIDVFNRELTVINEDSHLGVRMSRDEGEGVAWLKGVDFSEGTIEFDTRGEDVQNHSFVGIAFHGKDNATFDVIYLRPFRFRDQSEDLRSHQVQYMSLPDFTWRTLREKFPNKYEHAIENAPDPNSWVRVRVVVKGATVSTYINGSVEPSLVVDKVTALNHGSVGFYVADTSGGDFANITITKTN